MASIDQIEEFLNFMESFLETSPDSIVVLDKELKLLFANKNFKSIFPQQWGFELTDKFDFFSDPRLKGAYKNRLELFQLALKGQTQTFKETVKIGNEEFHFSMFVRALHSPNKELLGVVLNLRNDTSSKRMSSKLAAREATLHNVLNATPDGIYALDKNLKVIAINTQAAEDFREGGWEIEMGTNLHDVIEKDKLEKWNQAYFAKALNGESLSYEGPIDKKDGKTVHVQNRYRPMYDVENNIFAMLEISRDTTEAHEQAQTIKKQISDLDLTNQELNRYINSNLQLENFAYIASHDLKAPLRSVVSFAHLLKDKIYSDLDEKSQSYLDIVVKSSENMQNLIDDLLTYSRVKTETIKLIKLDLNALFARIILELDSDIMDQGATVNIPENLPMIIADESLLNQLFSNLIRNAIKFQKEGNSPIVDIEFSEDELRWNFSVKDNGIGIDEKNFEKIFATFEKLHSNDVYEGTGLGLTICKNIVEKHKGRIKVKSAPGMGTTFTFGISKKLHLKEEEELVNA